MRSVRRSSTGGGRPWEDAVDLLVRAAAVVFCTLTLINGLSLTLAARGGLAPREALGMALLVTAPAGMIVVLLGRDTSPRRRTLLLLQLSLGLLLVLPAAATPAVSTWWPMAFLMAGVVFAVAGDSGRRPVLAVAAVVTVHAVARAAGWSGSPVGFDHVRVLAAESGALVLAGAYMIIGQDVLTRAARAATAMRTARLRERDRASRQDAYERAAREVERFVHDEVVHTLRTIAMDRAAVPAADAVAAAVRLDEAFETLAVPAPDMPGDLAGRLRLVAARFRLHADMDIREDVALPADVADAFLRAAMEALRNVERHAGTDRVAITLSRAGAGVEVEIRDEGVGFDPADSARGAGWRSSILQRMLDAGGGATVSSRPGQGTTVRLFWEPADPPDAADGTTREFRPVVLAAVMPFVAMTVWHAFWLSPFLAEPWAGWLAAVIMGTTTVVCGVRSLRTGLTFTCSLGLVLALWAGTALVAWALPAGSTVPYWIAAGGSGILLVHAVSRPLRELVVAGAGLVIIAGIADLARLGTSSVGHEPPLVLYPLIGVLPTLVVGLLLTRMIREIRLAEAEVVRSRALLAGRLRLATELERRLDRLHDGVALFIRAVARGELDVTAPEVRAQAHELEERTRDRMFPTVTDTLDEVIGRLRGRGVSATVRIAEGAPANAQRHLATVLAGLADLPGDGARSVRATCTPIPDAGAWRVSVVLSGTRRMSPSGPWRRAGTCTAMAVWRTSHALSHYCMTRHEAPPPRREGDDERMTARARHTVRVTAVDDHPIVVEGLAALMTRRQVPDWLDELPAAHSVPELTWLGQSRTWAELLAKIEAWDTPPDVVLYDLYLNDGSVPEEGIAELVRRGIKVVVLTSELRPVPIRRAIQAGATGLVLKSDEVEKIVEVVRAAALGHFAVSSDLAFVLATDENLIPHLAPRELEVLRLLAEGVPRKSVGGRLDPPVKLATVVTYLNRVASRYQELGREVKTSLDVLRAAVEDGYIDPPGHSGPH